MLYYETIARVYVGYIIRNEIIIIYAICITMMGFIISEKYISFKIDNYLYNLLIYIYHIICVYH